MRRALFIAALAAAGWARADEPAPGPPRCVLERDGIACVQTLLYSPMLARGLKAIRGKEFGHWPEGGPGHADSTNYLALLREAETLVREAFERRADRAELRQKMLIEFLCSGAGAWVCIYAVELAEQDGEMRITAARLLGRRALSRDYARQAMDLMVENAFRPPAEEPP
jgi:hypothetical protein